MELDYRAIGVRIKVARIKAELTQERLAELTDLSTTHMSNIEKGSAKISLPTMVNIANILGVTLDDLMCDNVSKAKIQFADEVAEIFNDCNEYELRILKDSAMSLKDALRRNNWLLTNE